MLTIQDFPRVFQININNEIIELEEINDNLTAEQVKDLYTTQYPQLTNATIIQKGIQNDRIIVEFQTVAGTKG